MRAHFGLPSVTAEDTEGKPPIQVKFEIPYFTTSGIQVYLLNLNYAVVANIHVIAALCFLLLICKLFDIGSLPQNHRKIWLPSSPLGSIYYTERGLSTTNKLSDISKPNMLHLYDTI